MQSIQIDFNRWPNGHIQPGWYYFDESRGCERYHEPSCGYNRTEQEAVDAARRSLKRMRRRMGNYRAYAMLAGANVCVAFCDTDSYGTLGCEA